MPILENERWELFAQQLAKGENATKAYENAGFRRSRSNAARLSANENVRRRVSEIQQAAAKSAEVSVQSLIAELEDARAKATSLNQLSAAVRATAEKAKISGLLVEKQQIEVSQSDFTLDMSVPEILAKVAKECGPEKAVLLAMAFDTEDGLTDDIAMHRPAVIKKLNYIRELVEESAASAAKPVSQPQSVSQRSIEWRPSRRDRGREIR